MGLQDVDVELTFCMEVYLRIRYAHSIRNCSNKMLSFLYDGPLNVQIVDILVSY